MKGGFGGFGVEVIDKTVWKEEFYDQRFDLRLDFH